MNHLKFALRQLLKNPGFRGSDEWRVTSDGRVNSPTQGGPSGFTVTGH